jgi:hypothetical protein
MKCQIVKDLMPVYIDGLSSEETRTAVLNHIEECADCSTFYIQMTAEITQAVQLPKNSVNFLKKFKSKILRKNIIVAVSTVIIVLSSLVIFAKTYEIVIPYDCMWADVVPFAVVVRDDGSVIWDAVYNDDFENVVPGEIKHMMDGLIIGFSGFENISAHYIGRDIVRDGEAVRVIYFRLTKTPWVSLFFDFDLTEYGSSGWWYGTMTYGDKFQSLDYEPQMIEVYYLPVRNLLRLERLSDAEYDAQRFNGTFIWNGII